ncbi:hypothetical protein ILUMI_17902 [Ignelater luminosus]|uniref:Uncharacterized protein n=1 Tax=Ignelater luminosus TaxID=2038154 RepID=A0A8K0G1F2_IGNLU|nr:hypothetical protein ILUMI_17902 [Ignelater luminosus]
MNNLIIFNIIVVLFLIINIKIIKCEIEETPLCLKCSCTSDENGPEVDIDCTDDMLTLEFIYDQRNWINTTTNHTYYISTLNLKSSDLGDLRGQFPESNLTLLDFTDNLIRTIDDNYFAKLQNMSELVLTRNEIDRLKPDAFKGLRMDGDNYPLRSLKILKLNKNRLHTLHQDLFEHIEERLEVLDLSDNPFKVLDQQTTIAIGGIIYLKELYLGSTQIKKLPEHFLHTPKYLKVLDLSGNNFIEVPETLNDSHVLEVLYFNNNPIVNLTKDSGFPSISTLKVLHMCNMLELQLIGEKSMNGLTSLEEVHICNNNLLQEIDAGAFTREEFETEIWPPIKKLHLRDNKLTNLDRHLILHWENLNDLDLRFNPWTCECENEWMVDVLMPIYLNINETLAKTLQ